MCTSPQIPLREKLFFRMIYETTTRPREVLEARIELWNRTTGEITFPIPRSKYNRWTRRHIPGAPRAMKLTGNTSDILRHYVRNRKKRHIFINSRTDKRLTLRHFEKMIDKWARLLNIQKLQSIKPSGREYHLITLMGLKGGRREAL
jgi:site-specific recombinase XerD